MVELEQTIEGCERILNDEFSEVPESALYMIGSIDEVRTSEGTGRSEPGKETRETGETGEVETK